MLFALANGIAKAPCVMQGAFCLGWKYFFEKSCKKYKIMLAILADSCYNKSCSAAVAQLVERILGKDEVSGPNPDSGSIAHPSGWAFLFA